jgi:hypothetical protein
VLVSIPFTTRPDASASSGTTKSDLLHIDTQQVLVNVDTVSAIHVVRFTDGTIGFDVTGPGLEERGYVEDYDLITETTFRQLLAKADVTILDA